MRGILFRGKRLDNGEWVKGDFISSSAYADRAWITEIKTLFNREICEIGVREVDPSTVGQYTGLTDKNGVKIFDGDILRIDEPEFIQVFGIVRFGKHDFNVGFFVEWLNDRIFYRNDLRYWVERPYCAVRGNIHDNPELLKEKEN